MAVSQVVVVCDNTMGAPGLEIDDGLALLYLLGCNNAPKLNVVITTHGNADCNTTANATRTLLTKLAPQLPLVCGQATQAAHTKLLSTTNEEPPAARELIYQAHATSDKNPIHLLSLGATTELALAEQMEPGTLAHFQKVSLMGGIRHTLVVGGHIMDELNFSVDAPATFTVFSAARTSAHGMPAGAHLYVADAQSCLPLTFAADEFIQRLGSVGPKSKALLERYCSPWFEHARTTWGVHGFVGWDVLAAVALAHPEYVSLEPAHITLNPRLFELGLLEAAPAGAPAAHIQLVHISNSTELIGHVYEAWERALALYEVAKY